MQKVHVMTVKDDPTLLDVMMSEMSHADALYQPTNYWAAYERSFLPELRKLGLANFRQRRHSILESFGAVDMVPFAEFVACAKIRGTGRLARCFNVVSSWLPGFKLVVQGYDAESTVKYFHHQVAQRFKVAGLDLQKCGTSDVGSPEGATEISGARWTARHLNYCMTVASAVPHVPFTDDMVFVEIGPGLGRNAEVLAKLYPQATIVLFDIPPQLYVLEQYLTAVFGNRILGYRTSTALAQEPNRLAAIRGKIVVLPTWHLPLWQDVQADIFWNSASFQEMEPDVVRNYLRLVKGLRPKCIYLNELAGGNYWGKPTPHAGGTLEPVTDEIYLSALADSYDCIARYPTEYFLHDWDYTSYVFSRRG